MAKKTPHPEVPSPADPAPLVSVITPAYNAAAYIHDTVRSVLAQTMCDWEMVVVDDGSTDDTVAVARAAAAGDARVRVIEAPHGGLPAIARNRALDAARGTYMAFLDADDLWEPDKLETQMAAAKGRVGWGFSNSRFFGGGTASPDGLKYPAQWRPACPFHPQVFVTESVPFLTVFAHRQLLAKIAPGGELRRTFHCAPGLKAVEDWDVVLRLAAVGEPVYTPRPLARYRVHAGGISKQWEQNYKRTMNLIRHHARRGVDGALCRRAARLQVSKRATNRMLAGGGPWRGMLLRACMPPASARDAFMLALVALPVNLARRAYSAALASRRSGG